MTTKSMRHEKVGAGFQAITFLIAFVCLSVFFTIRYHFFIPNDPIMPLIAAKTTDKKIDVGLHITHFSTFDVAKNTFVMDGTVWFFFNTHDVSLETIKKFDVFNGDLLHVGDVKIIDHDENATIAQFRIRAEFHTPLNYRLYPLDDHRIHFVIFNRFLPDNVMLQSHNKDITFSDALFLPGWRIIGHEIRTGIKKFTLKKDNKTYSDSQQEAIISLDCERTDPSIIINFLLTLLLMLFLATLTFSSDEDSVLIVTVGIVALISYRSVMQTMAPSQVSYFIYSDYIYLFALVGVIITLFAGIITRDRADSSRVKKYYIVGVYALFITACIATSLLLS